MEVLNYRSNKIQLTTSRWCLEIRDIFLQIIFISKSKTKLVKTFTFFSFDQRPKLWLEIRHYSNCCILEKCQQDVNDLMTLPSRHIGQLINVGFLSIHPFNISKPAKRNSQKLFSCIQSRVHEANARLWKSKGPSCVCATVLINQLLWVVAFTSEALLLKDGPPLMFLQLGNMAMRNIALNRTYIFLQFTRLQTTNNVLSF